jgi:DUF1365 family protein
LSRTIFNPLSVYFCYQRDSSLAAILYEVHNTFRERHSYLIPVDRDAGLKGVVGAPGAVISTAAKASMSRRSWTWT